MTVPLESVRLHGGFFPVHRWVREKVPARQTAREIGRVDDAFSEADLHDIQAYLQTFGPAE